MASLNGNLISSTYQSLLKIGTNNTASVNLNNVSDGLGNVTGLYVSTATTAVSGTFAVLGNMTVSGIVAATSSNATSASYALSSSFAVNSGFALSSSFALTSNLAVTASNANLLNGLVSTVFATTGSNQFKNSQSITGSVNITNVLRLTAQDPLPAASTVPNSFAISASTPTKPYYSDGTSWNALY
jgi:hypothetical protein